MENQTAKNVQISVIGANRMSRTLLPTLFRKEKKMRTRLLFLTLLLFLLTSAQATVIFNDGQAHNVDYQITEQVEVRNNPSTNKPTVLNLLSGSSFSLSVKAYDSSSTNLSGGSVYGSLQLYDYATAQISSGSITYQLMADGNNYIDFCGGNVGEFVIAYNSATVKMSGGSVGLGFRINYDSVVVIQGDNFLVNGQTVEYGEIKSLLGGSHFDEPTRSLSGMLSSGETLNTNFWIGQNGRIILEPIPEPATFLLLGLGIPILSGLRRNR